MPDRPATAPPPGPASDDHPASEQPHGASPLAFHPLVFQSEGDEVTVGRLDEGTFVVLPADGAALLRRLVDGAEPAEAARWYARSYGETVDIAEFVTDLGELGFLRDPDQAPAPPPAPVRWQRLGRAVFSPVGAALYLALLAGSVVVLARSPELVPGYRHLFFTPYLSVLVIVMFVAQAPLILVHEAAHALAGRRLGLPSRLSVGRRLYFVVVQTELDGLVTVDRRRRILPMLAGVLADLGVLAVLTLVAAGTRHSDGALSAAGGVALGLAYSTVLRVIWQALFFLRTDGYYLVVTVLGCVDLHTTAKQLLADRWARLRGRPAPYDPEGWHPRDRAVARWYSVLMALGYATALATLAVNLPPIVTRASRSVLDQLSAGGGHRWAGLADSIVFLFLTVGELAVSTALYLRERRARRAAAVPDALPAAP
ncbi:hypothetical protein ABZW10_16925 [Kitasatospora sp. NPDC004723]|uniref:hypothetical protein n=1 Tax=Kitasatospora sp. NPDC004723 TaxID=3154288 RepID=UPI0033B42E65